jgi:hypothetical protein
MDDLADALTYSLSRTGAGGMLAPFRIDDGNVTAPGLAYLNETNTGLYRSGAGSTWMSVLGVNTAQFSTVGLTIPSGKAFTAQGAAYLTSTLAVTGATTMASTLAVTGAITATGGVIGNVTGNVTSAGTSTFFNTVITGSLDMTVGSAATITGLSTPTNASDAANKGYVDTQDALRLALTGGTMSGAIAMGTSKITGLGTPTADQDAATKVYVDSVAQGLDVKASCRAATIANITLSGAQTIDGVVIIAGDRVLVKDQSTAANNGIYLCASGAWTRTTDADTWIELTGAFTFIEEGTVNDNSGWVCTIAPGGTLGTTAVTFEQFSGAGQVIAGAGLTKTGNTLNVGTASSARIVVNTDDIDLATTGVGASTYQSVTVDTYGRITGGTNPTTLAGYNISDAYTQTQINTALALKLNLTGGTMSGAIAMGASKITGMADPTTAQDAATKNYIDTIFGSTTSAAASATAAAASASAASTSATNSATSATASAASATSSALSYTTFNNQYLGSYATNPTVNNTGGPLVTGNLYWNSTSNEMRVYSGSAWIAAYLPSSTYLALTGGTMTGAITFAGAQTWPTFNQNTTGNAATVTTNANLTGAVTSVGNASSLGSFTSSQLATALTDETGSGANVFATSPTLVTPALGTPSSGVVTNLTGTASININGTVGATTATTGAFTSLTASTTLEVTGVSTLTGGAVVQGLTVGRGAGAVASNTVLGASALTGNSTQNLMVAVGYGALSSGGGSGSVAVGANALTSQTSAGGPSTAVGQSALSLEVSGYYNSAFGTSALAINISGNNCTGIGRAALAANTASGSTAVGSQAGYSNTTGQITAIGFQAGYSNLTGIQSTFVGYQAGLNTTGSANTFVGAGTNSAAGYSVTTGSKNTILGGYSGNMGGLDIRTASNYIVLSDGDGNPSAYRKTAGDWVFGTGGTASDNQGAITLNGNAPASGNGAYIYGLSNGTGAWLVGSYRALVSGTATWLTCANSGGGGVYLNGASATSWTAVSDETRKVIIEPITDAANKVSTLRAVIGRLKTDDESVRRPYLIAQDVQAVLPEAVSQAEDKEGAVLGLSYTEVIPLLVAAIKEQQATIIQLKARLDAANL